MKLKQKIISLAIIGIMALSVPAPSYSFGVDGFKSITQKTATVKKSEAKHVFGKFLKSMLLVAGSCGAIYLLLTLYKRFRAAKVVQVEETNIEKNLNSPETIEEATKFVIEKF